MTNLHSFAGGFVWAAVAAILMLATFKPVSLEKAPSAPVPQFSAEAPAPAADVAA